MKHEFIKVFQKEKPLKWGLTEATFKISSHTPTEILSAWGLMDEGKEAQTTDLSTHTLEQHWAVTKMLMKSSTLWLQSFMAMFPWNWHHTSETSPSVVGCATHQRSHKSLLASDPNISMVSPSKSLTLHIFHLPSYGLFFVLQNRNVLLLYGNHWY